NKSKRGGAHVTARQWVRLFRFRTTWAMILGAFCSGYGIWMYVTWLPGYLEGQHHISIARTGYLASIPLIFSIIGSFCGGWASDRLVLLGVSLVKARKLPAALGYLASGLFTALAACSEEPAAAILWI